MWVIYGDWTFTETSNGIEEVSVLFVFAFGAAEQQKLYTVQDRPARKDFVPWRHNVKKALLLNTERCFWLQYIHICGLWSTLKTWVKEEVSSQMSVTPKLNEELLWDQNLRVYLTRILKWIWTQHNWLCGNSSILWSVTFWARRNETLPEEHEVCNRSTGRCNAECHWKYTCYTHTSVISR